MYHYLLWCGPKLGFHLGPLVLLHSEKVAEEDFAVMLDEAVKASTTKMPGVLDYLAEHYGFVKVPIGGFTYVEFP